MITIRRAVSGDFEAVFRLICLLEDDTIDRGELSRIYEENLADRDIVYLVAEVDGVVSGFGSLHIQRLLHHAGPVGEIEELIVSMEARGQGIGGKLFEKLSRIATDRHCLVLEVSSNLERKKAHTFYQRRGLKQTHAKLTKALSGPTPIRRSFTYEAEDAKK